MCPYSYNFDCGSPPEEAVFTRSNSAAVLSARDCSSANSAAHFLMATSVSLTETEAALRSVRNFVLAEESLAALRSLFNFFTSSCREAKVARSVSSSRFFVATLSLAWNATARAWARASRASVTRAAASSAAGSGGGVDGLPRNEATSRVFSSSWSVALFVAARAASRAERAAASWPSMSAGGFAVVARLLRRTTSRALVAKSAWALASAVRAFSSSSAAFEAPATSGGAAAGLSPRAAHSSTRFCAAANWSGNGGGLASRVPSRFPSDARQTATRPAKSVAMTREPSWVKAQRKAVSPKNSQDFSFEPSALQVVTTPSRPQVTELPSCENATHITPVLWAVQVRACLPSLVSQSFTEPSSLDEATTRESSRQLRNVTAVLCPTVVNNSWPLSASQMTTPPLRSAVARNSPLGLKATAVTQSV